MRISMLMMIDALGDTISECHTGPASKRLGIAAVFPLPESGATEPNVLYVCDMAQKDMSAEWRADCFYLLVGPVPQELDAPEFQHARIADGISANAALCAAIAAFRRFGEWHARLMDELLGARDLSRLCEVGSDLIGHAIMIYDRNYAVIGNSLHEDDAVMEGMLEKRSSYFMTSPAMVNRLMRSEAFQQTFATRGAAVYDDASLDDHGIRSLYVNLARGSGYEGRIVIPYYDNSVLPGDFQLAEIFADAVRLALKQPSLQSDDLDRVFRIYLNELIEGRASAGRQLDDSLRLWNWQRTGSYLCLWATLASSAIEAEMDAYLGLRLEREMPGACTLRRGNGIVCVAVLGKDMGADEARRRFGEVAGGFSEDMGSSEPYSDVLQTDEYFREAQIACESASGRSASDEVVRFADVALAHFHACGTSRLSAAHFCDPCVRALLPYRGTQRDYYNTLKVYLEHNMNLLHASEALFVHRTTLFKHLKEIRATTGADLDDIPTRLRMLASFEIMAMADQALDRKP